MTLSRQLTLLRRRHQITLYPSLILKLNTEHEEVFYEEEADQSPIDWQH